MKKLTMLLLLVGAMVLTSQSRATATILTFEDLTGSGSVPVNYQGLTWTHWTHYDVAQSPYNASSGVQRIFNDPRDNSNLIEFNQSVTFQGLWMAGYAHGQYIIGYSAGNPIFFSAPQLSDASEFGAFINVNWSGIDAISVHADDFNGIQDYYILDDITYSDSRVPDGGSTVLLLGVAMSAMGIVRRFVA